MGKKYSLTNRKVLATNNKLATKAAKITGTDAESTMMMGQVIYNYRRSLKHKGITMIKAGTPQYTILKDITKNVLEFYNDFEDHFTSVKDAAIKYVEIANTFMNKTSFNITRIPSLHERITNTYQSKLEVMEDKNIEITERAYKAYIRKVIEMTGTLLDDPKNNPSDMVNFTQVSKRCVELKIKPEFYIEAQFFGLEFCNGIPTPAQLTGAKSLSYVQRYKLSQPAEELAKETVNKETVNRFKKILSS